MIGNQYILNMKDFKKSMDIKPSAQLSMNIIKGIFKSRYGKEDFWIDRLPWMQDRFTDPDDFNMRLEVEGERGFLGRHTSSEIVEYKNISSVINSKDNPKSALVRAKSGFGKTALCKIIAHDWAKSGTRPRFASQYELVILYQLRNLSADAKSLSEELIKFCQSEKVGYEQASDALEAHAPNVLVLLDGYDEITKAKRKLVDELFKEKKFGFEMMTNVKRSSRIGSVFRESTCVLTSDFLDGFEAYDVYDRIIRIESLGYHRKFLKTYSKIFFKGCKVKRDQFIEATDSLKNDLDHNMSPLFLFILCQLFENNEWQKTISGFGAYEAISRFLLSSAEGEEDFATKVMDALGLVFFNSWNENTLTELFPVEVVQGSLGGMFEKVVRSRYLSVEGGRVRAIHRQFVEFLVTRHLKQTYSNLENNEKRLDLLAEVVKPGKANAMVYEISSSKKYILSETRFGHIHFRWNVTNDDPNLMSEKSSFEMACDNADLFKYQFPDVIMVLFNKKIDRFPHASTFFPARLPGQRCLSLLSEHLEGVNFSMFFYQEIFKQTEGDMVIVSTKCFDDQDVPLWKGKIFCYHLLPPEQFGLIDVRKDKPFCPRLKIKNTSLKRKLSLQKKDYNWTRDFLSQHLQCTMTIPEFDKDLISEGKLIYDILTSLTTCPLYDRVLFSVQLIGFTSNFRPQATIILKAVILIRKSRVVIVKAAGQFMHAELTTADLANRKEDLIGKFSVEGDKGIISLSLLAKNTIEEEERSDSESDDNEDPFKQEDQQN